MSMSPSIHTPFLFFFFNDTATTEIYTLSLHDALPISPARRHPRCGRWCRSSGRARQRSEEHTSELQSHSDLVCRLLLEKKKPSRDAIAGVRRSRSSIERPNGPSLSECCDRE